MAIRIRPAKIEDLSALSEIYVDSYITANVGEEWTEETAEKFMKYLYDRQPDLFFVAEYDGELAGGAAVGIKPWWDGDHAYDGGIFVRPKFQKKGVAKKLFQKILEEAIKKHNISVFEAITFSDRKFPLDWYKKLGLKAVDNLLIISGDPREVLNNLKQR